MSNTTIEVTIRNPDKVVLSKTVNIVGSINELGPFDILPKHEHFISVIKEKIILHHTNGEREEMDIDKGIMSVWEDQVFVYLGL